MSHYKTAFNSSKLNLHHKNRRLLFCTRCTRCQHNIVQLPIKDQWGSSALLSFIKTPLFLGLVAKQKPKTAWLLHVKTEAAFCLSRVHLIILHDSHWVSFSFQLQVEGRLPGHTLSSSENNQIIEACQAASCFCNCTSCYTGLVWVQMSNQSQNEFSRMQELVRWFCTEHNKGICLQNLPCAYTVSTLEEFRVSKNRHDTCFPFF